MKRYEAYNITTQTTVATADTITALADMIYISRQTVSKAVQQNLLREYSPKVFPGGIVVRDTWTTERCKPLKKPKKRRFRPLLYLQSQHRRVYYSINIVRIV